MHISKPLAIRDLKNCMIVSLSRDYTYDKQVKRNQKKSSGSELVGKHHMLGETNKNMSGENGSSSEVKKRKFIYQFSPEEFPILQGVVAIRWTDTDYGTRNSTDRPRFIRACKRALVIISFIAFMLQCQKWKLND